MHIHGLYLGMSLMRLILAFALFFCGAVNAQSFTVTPSNATLSVQQDGTCRGHLEYHIAETGVVDDAGAPIIESGAIEIKTGCARLGDIVSGEVFDTSGGKLTISAPSATITKTTADADGDGPRLAGDCDIVVKATAAIRKQSREVVRAKASHSCTPLDNLVANACWVARGSWHEAAPFPVGITKCP